MTTFIKTAYKQRYMAFISLIAAIVLYGCSNTEGNPGAGMAMPAPSLPVITINNTPATTYQEYTASVEGTRNIDVRPQVDGYLDKIFVDEGAFVKKGQPLFKIDGRPYEEQLNNAKANLLAAKANLSNAEINVSKLEPLVKNNVVSDVQLQSAKASYEAAKASVAQAEASANNAKINLGYSLVSAPFDGYIGKIPYKIGSLVGKNDAQPLTVVSEIREMYVYFSMSESDFLNFTSRTSGKTVEEKIHGMPPVELQLADKSIYASKGKIELVEGQFDKSIGAISFRAVFPNAGGLLRSGSTGRIRIPKINATVLAVPQQATYELQDKIFVFTVNDSNKVSSKAIGIAGQTTGWYLVDKGLQPGEKIVFAGMDRLQDGASINPQLLSADSLLRVMPL
ncbi:MAG: efflux RND transporter periplasmic adaptor subunit [Puia sp.]|nr:efflux RND transporter periplasmic adaptor subunit [Puia sp.]